MNAKNLPILMILLCSCIHAGTLGTAVTYQGELKRNGIAVNGPFDFEFMAYDLDVGGSPIANTILMDDVDVMDGIFTVELDFGGQVFSGGPVWLEIRVRDGATSGGYTGLLPRQEFTPVPYALHAEEVAFDAVNDADADATNEIQDLSLNGNTLSLTSDTTSVDLSGFLDDTDVQDLTLSGNTLSLTNDATTVDLSGYLDNMDAQDLSLSDNMLSLTNDGTPVDLSAYLDNTDSQDLALAGNVLSLTGDASAVDLSFFDLFPANPRLAGSLGVGTNPNSLSVSGRHAYVLDFVSADLRVIDVSDPTAPRLTGSLVVGGLPLSLHVAGRYAFVTSATTNDLKVIDVSDASSPTLAGSVAVGPEPAAVFVAGRYAYVVDQTSRDLKIIDVSDPTAPGLVGSAMNIGQGNSVVVSGPYAYVVGSTGGLRVIDVSDPNAPVQVGNTGVGSSLSVAISGNYAYLVDLIGELQIVDVSDPTTPDQVSSLAVGGNPTAVFVAGRYAYVVGQLPDNLKVIDVSVPGTPSVVGSLSIGGAPNSLVLSGRYAYVADDNSDDLKVIDVSGAQFPSLIAHSLERGELQVRNDLNAQGHLRVAGGLNVGAGGVYSDGNVGVTGTVAIANDVAPTSSPANLVQLFAEDVAASSELKVRDEAGNITTLSPHNFSLIGEPSEPMAWSFFSENQYGSINVDMLRTVRLVEKISGETLVYTVTNDGAVPRIDDPARDQADVLMQTVEELRLEGDRKDAEILALKRRLDALEKKLGR